MNALALLVPLMIIAAPSSAESEINAGVGFSAVFTNNTAADDSQQSGHRRSVVKATDTDQCYRQFFVGGIPPSYISTGNSRFICQESGTSYCFSTMFDLSYGIPVYSAYVVGKGQAGMIGRATRKSLNFRQEPDIPAKDQGSTEMYSEANKGVKSNQKFHKGHLVPAETYSFDADHMRSTFTYTNAVPQYATFNSGQWAQYEKKIRIYAQTTCSKKNGDLYLLTGIADIQISKQGGAVMPPGTPKRISMPPNIVIPNSMWTAGCCVSGRKVLGSFAVIGNNVIDKLDILMSQLVVSELEGKIGVGLFPGNPDCSNMKYHVTI